MINSGLKRGRTFFAGLRKLQKIVAEPAAEVEKGRGMCYNPVKGLRKIALASYERKHDL